MDSTQKSIFNFTEITTVDTEKSSLLPHLTKTPKTSSLRSKPLSSSKNRTISSLLALSSKTLTSPKTSSPESLDTLKSKVLNDLKLASTRSESHIMSWDIEENLKTEVSSLQKIISTKQREYNKVHNEADKKEEQLSRLKAELAGLHKGPVDEAKAILKTRNIEQNEIQKALDNENYYIETLKHMLNDRKKVVLRTEPPVLKMKSQVLAKKREIANLENILERFHKEICDFEKEADALQQEISNIKSQKEESYQHNFAIVKQKVLMEEILSKEFTRNSKVHEKEQKTQLIRMLKPMKQKAESEEKTLSRYADKLKDQEFYEKIFSQLKEATFTNNFEEISESYEILKEHTEMLEVAAVQSMSRIESLTSERARTMSELNEIILNHEDERKINYREFDRIEQNLKEKNKLMDENEKTLTSLGVVMGSICGSVTRISSQLLGSQIIDVKPRTVVKYFFKCIKKIEEKLSLIMNQQLTSSDMHELAEKFPSIMAMYGRRYSVNSASEESLLQSSFENS